MQHNGLPVPATVRSQNNQDRTPPRLDHQSHVPLYASPQAVGFQLDYSGFRAMLSCDIGGGCMADMLIRDVPEAVVAAVDAHAVRLGLSRSEYVRRRLAQDADVSGSSVEVSDLTRLAELTADLADPAVMDRAWH